MAKLTRHKKHSKHVKTRKLKFIKNIILPNLTPEDINEVSEVIFQEALIDNSVEPSYSPTVNKELVTLKSISREKVIDCNNEKAFELKEPLQIGITEKLFGKNCVPYYEPKAIKFLLKNLSANKHIKIDKIVPPIQSQSNCWFNTMFVTLFVSDKGRKFFHFFRQLMIKGIQANGSSIPWRLRNGFALLNYAIECCLTGNKYAYILDTNAIIRNIYANIPQTYKDKLPYITNINEAGNPIRYYDSLIYYLNNKSIELAFIKNTNDIKKRLNEIQNVPHIIILEFYDEESKRITNKPQSFFVKEAKYMLDSIIIRDTSQQHFSATLTCEGKEMAYDGMSFHRIVSFNWKKYINKNYFWEFDGSNNLDGSSLKWNFTNGYQMLIYYRVK
jgi:hypothetical protein